MTTLVLIDAGLPDLELLLGGLEAGCHAVLVQRDQDAQAVLTAAAAACVAAGTPWRLAVVAHGAPGTVFIGREPLTAAAIERRAAAWAGLAPAAVDLYSCHTGLDSSLAAALAAATGARVSSSKGIVGHAALGGNWGLESPAAATAANGVVPFSRAAREAWVVGLVDFYYSTSPSGDGSGSDIDNPSDDTATARTTLLGEDNVYIVAGSGPLVLQLQNNDNISGSLIVPAHGTIYRLSLDSGASVTMTAAQHNDANLISGSGSETITLTTADNVTGDGDIEAYVLAQGSQQFTVGANGQQINADALLDGQTLTLLGSDAVTVSSTEARSFCGLMPTPTSAAPHSPTLMQSTWLVVLI